jgi:predicted ATPase with chaperone activity
VCYSWTRACKQAFEFGPRVLEVLRQPVEDKLVTISRAQGSLTFPPTSSWWRQ